MVRNKGKILSERLHKYSHSKGITLTKIANAAGYNQSTMYRHFERPDLPDHILIKYGKIIRHDFSEEIPELKEAYKFPAKQDISETDFHSEEKEVKEFLKNCIKERDYWQKKYIDLLERHNALLIDKLQKKQ